MFDSPLSLPLPLMKQNKGSQTRREGWLVNVKVCWSVSVSVCVSVCVCMCVHRDIQILERRSYICLCMRKAEKWDDNGFVVNDAKLLMFVVSGRGNPYCICHSSTSSTNSYTDGCSLEVASHGSCHSIHSSLFSFLNLPPLLPLYLSLLFCFLSTLFHFPKPSSMTILTGVKDHFS